MLIKEVNSIHYTEAGILNGMTSILVRICWKTNEHRKQSLTPIAINKALYGSRRQFTSMCTTNHCLETNYFTPYHICPFLMP